MEGPGADSEEKRVPASDVDTVMVDSLKALDPNRPLREADIPGGDLCLKLTSKPACCRPNFCRGAKREIRLELNIVHVVPGAAT